MTSEPPEHRFEPRRAAPFRPRRDFAKTAILLEPAADDATTRLRTPFGEQTLRGAFYVVAEGSGSYGAAKDEFENAHELVEPNRWVKQAPVRAYRIDEPATVVTWIGGREESTVVAEPGDWIVRQSSGEVMVVVDREFEARYEPVVD